MKTFVRWLPVGVADVALALSLSLMVGLVWTDLSAARSRLELESAFRACSEDIHCKGLGVFAVGLGEMFVETMGYTLAFVSLYVAVLIHALAQERESRAGKRARGIVVGAILALFSASIVPTPQQQAQIAEWSGIAQRP